MNTSNFGYKQNANAQNYITNLKYGALDEPLGRSVKKLSALRPSATTKTSLEAGGASCVAWGGMPWTSGEVK